MTADNRDHLCADSPDDPRDALFSTADLDHGGLGARAASGAAWAMSATALKIVLQFGSVAVIARFVPPSEFGVAAMAIPIMTIMMGLSQFGLAHPIIQRPFVTHTLANTLFWANIALGGTITAVVIALSPLAAVFYGEPRVGAVFVALTLSVLFAGALVQYSAILRRRMRFRALEAVLLASEATGAFVGVVAAMAGASYWAVVGQQVTIHGASLLAMIVVTGWRPSPPPLRAAHWAAARESIGFGGAVAVYSLLNQATQSLGSVISGRMLGEAAAATYYRGWTLSNYPEARLTSALSGAFLPALSRAVEDPAMFRLIYADILRRLAMLLMPLGSLLVTGGDLLIAVLLGPQWVASGPVLSWLGLLALAAPLNASLIWALIASGAARLLTLHGAFSLLAVGAAMAFAAGHGLRAMAAAYGLTALCVLAPALLTLAARGTALDPRAVGKRFLGDLAGALATIAVVTALRQALESPSLTLQIIVVGCAIAVCQSLIIMIDPGNRRDMVAVARRMAKAARG